MPYKKSDYLCKMNTEFKDLEWIKEVVENPWHEYNYILFDKEPKKDDIHRLVQLAFDSGLICSTNKNSWLDDFDSSINDIIFYFKRDGYSYLRIIADTLRYGSCEEKDGYKWINYSTLFEY